MSYSAAIDQLNAMAPELYVRPGQPRRKFSLDEVRILLAALGDPHLGFRSVLIAGTNGKGSTASTLASILTASGARIGLYTSPHLERVNERIRLANAEISDDNFARLYFRVQNAAQQLVQQGSLPQHPSFFEILTALAFLYFAEAKVDLAVLEVGMGGRLDATNVVDPLLSIITDISLDHTEWLGTTLAAIAREKAGILRPGGRMIRLPQFTEADDVLSEVAQELGVRRVDAIEYLPSRGTGVIRDERTVEVNGVTIEVKSPLAGGHQNRNIALAIAAAVELACDFGFPITPYQIAEGIRTTKWPGRLERLTSGGVDWILDVAHNPAGAWAVRSGLDCVPGGHEAQTLIFSCLRDKPVAEMAQILFPLFARVILTPLHTARAAAMEDLLAAAQLTETPFLVAESVADALRLARMQAGRGPILVSGSVYLVGEARSLLLAVGAKSGGRAS
jgi:dihydrofolate synthase/folylpolyglutamate synthase